MALRNESPDPWKGSNKVCDMRQKCDGMNLNIGTYTMYKTEFDVLIEKRENLKLDSYDLLRGFRHPNSIPLLDFYYQGHNSKFGRLVIPKVDFSFSSWLESGGKALLFDELGHMTATLEKLILEFCDLVENLLRRKLIISTFDVSNIFVNVFDGVPTLCILLTQVERALCISVHQRKLAWDCPRKFMAWCEDKCQIKRDQLTESFCTFLGKSNCNVNKLNKYPHNWDYVTKGEYLLSLVASRHSDMRFQLEGKGLKWPFLENRPPRPDNLPELLQSILEWDKQDRKVLHDTSDFFSYVIVLRNCYKHYEKMPEKIRDTLVSRKALIEHVEIWNPDFWIKVYEILGWP